MLFPLSLLLFAVALCRQRTPFALGTINIGENIGELPALPAVAGEGRATQIEVGGESVKLEELGPIIVNEDGTMRRITNWHTLTKGEQLGTIKAISKRNKRRLDKLKEQAAQQKQKQK